ncbi:GNAT family N-acetyltransferase [Actinocrispum wychmicini]|uniref:Enamine deaminase RidA (YjgF/YER057c/UK114 family) n=1 Tax=Actinocrispum wychmicini TaxID=1213861 RepID=A0A4R2J8R3_9PSEU|nr:GNAT family N-acetyltransferase [Actinocrispum wychmicini]TCO52928.1 enamine deaminase RidA (YjgF/YER057c/UK114 family) [Actinocrispum wychmicini]
MPVDFRPLAREDFPVLRQWLAAPHVRAWWDGEPSDVERKYGPRADDPEPVRVFVIQLDGVPLGMIQCCRLDGRAVGIDYLIGDSDRVGQGLGTAAIAAFTRLVFDLYPDATTVTADPAPANHASRRALEKAGFRLSEVPAGANVIYVRHRALDDERPAPMALEIIQPDDLDTPKTYSHVIAATGNRLVFVAGQMSDDLDGTLIHPGDLAAQARQVFTNLGRALAAARARPDQVTRITIYVVGHRPEYLPVIEAARIELFGAHKPTDTLLGVQTLAAPGYLIEVDAIAVTD